MQCFCGASLVDGFQHVAGGLECFTFSDTCLTNVDAQEDFCGAVLLEAEISAELGTSLSGSVTTCLAANIPEGLGYYDVCIDAAFTGTGISSCAATMNQQSCHCSPCDGFSVLFDCSHIDLSPFPGFPLHGPKAEVCQSLDFQQSA